MSNQNPTYSPKIYDKISYDRRVQLIELVQEQKCPVSQCAEFLKIKLSTAKMIVYNYRKTGVIFKPKSQPKIKKIQKQNQQKKNVQIVQQNLCENNEDLSQSNKPPSNSFQIDAQNVQNPPINVYGLPWMGMNFYYYQ